ncbi:HlyD family efflux transporter periplasmic adaptor subunit [Patescibacteria group bacterium]|nr:HlyD family efflux transporter periplasmic adaptor subunit [Patescibacteria group bacterium]
MSLIKNHLGKIIIAIILVIVGGILTYRIIERQKQMAIKEEQIPVIAQVSLINASDYKESEAVVKAVGTVKSSNQIDLRAETSGKIDLLNATIGDKVTTGQLIAEINHDSIDSQLAQSSATIERMQANLDLRIAGVSNEEVKRAQAGIEQAEAGLLQTQARLTQTIIANKNAVDQAQNGIEKLKLAIQNDETGKDQGIDNSYENFKITLKQNVDAIKTSLNEAGNILGKEPGEASSNDAYEDVLGAKDFRSLNNLKNEFDVIVEYIKSVETTYSQIAGSNDKDEIIAKSKEIEKSLNQMSTVLSSLRKVLDNTIVKSGFNDTALNGLKMTIDGQIQSINGQLRAYQAGEQAIINSELASKTTGDSLDLDLEKALENINSLKQQNEQTAIAAQTSVIVAQAALNQAKAGYDIAVATPRGVDLAGLKAGIKEAQAAYGLILKNRNKAFIKAPFTATVAAVPIEKGDIINPGQIVASLVNENSLIIKAYISHVDLSLVDPGSPVIINNKINGKVTAIAPRIDPQTKKIEIEIIINDKNPLVTVGEFVDLAIKITSAEQNDPRFYLPIKSIKVTDTDNYVFTIDANNKITSKKIQVGKIIGDKVEILGGLNDSDKIASSVRGLNEGDEVKVN